MTFNTQLMTFNALYYPAPVILQLGLFWVQKLMFLFFLCSVEPGAGGWGRQRAQEREAALEKGNWRGRSGRKSERGGRRHTGIRRPSIDWYPTCLRKRLAGQWGHLRRKTQPPQSDAGREIRLKCYIGYSWLWGSSEKGITAESGSVRNLSRSPLVLDIDKKKKKKLLNAWRRWIRYVVIIEKIF